MAQINTEPKTNNKRYNLKDMMKQPDKDEFTKAIEKEVSLFFKEDIWKMVPKAEMNQHFMSQWKQGKNINR